MKALLLTMLCFSIIISCHETPIENNEPTLNDAWLTFQRGQYDSSKNVFTSFLTAEPLLSNVGIGWCELKLNNFTQAEVAFDLSISQTHSLAGQTFIKWRLGKYSIAIQHGDSVLIRNPFYIFEYDQNVTESDIKLVQAYSYYHLANYNACMNIVTELLPSYSGGTNPNNLLIALNQLAGFSKIIS